MFKYFSLLLSVVSLAFCFIGDVKPTIEKDGWELLEPEKNFVDCVKDQSCLGAFKIPDTNLGFLYYGSKSLTETNEDVTDVVMMGPGLHRDGDNYFSVLMKSSEIAEDLYDEKSTALFVPQFLAKADLEKLGALELPSMDTKLSTEEGIEEWMQFRGGDWIKGKPAKNSELSGYDMIDYMIKLCKKNYPNLKKVTFAGQSATAQMVQRYAATSNIKQDIEPVKMSYVITAPRTWLYFDTTRMTEEANKNCNVDGTGCPTSADDFQTGYYNETCTNYNDWFLGLDKLVGYAEKNIQDTDKVPEKYFDQDIVYFIGDQDVVDRNKDDDCDYLAQGSSRLNRLMVWMKYVEVKYNQTPKWWLLKGCGHDIECKVINHKDPTGAKLLFGGAEAVADNSSSKSEEPETEDTGSSGCNSYFSFNSLIGAMIMTFVYIN